MAKHQAEIDEADLFERECNRMEDLLWSKSAEEIYAGLKTIDNRIAAEFCNLIAFLAVTFVKNGISEP